jgi:hypothetical protein
MTKVVKSLRLALGSALVALGSAACGSSASDADLERIDELEAEIRGGSLSPTGAFEAVGFVNGGGCSGTLITSTTVLTAGHCVCSGPETTPLGSNPAYFCSSRATFTFTNVFPKDNPATPVNEALSRANVSIGGNVVVHPNYTRGQWLSNDYALIKLDRRIEELTLAVRPIQVERPSPPPAVGNVATIVGYGKTDDGGGNDCDVSGGLLKRSTAVTIDQLKRYDVDADGDFDSVDAIAGRTIVFGDSAHGSCPGDSGGPALSANGRVIGVASSIGGSDSNYDPTYLVYDWLGSHSCAPFDNRFPDASFCSDPMCPCGNNEGDCDNDAECAGSLVCKANIGGSLGLPADYDVCRPPPPPSSACPAGQFCCEPGPGSCSQCIPSGASCP